MDSEGKPASTAPRRKFVPKAPPRRDQKPIVPKTEKIEDDYADIARTQELSLIFKDASTRIKRNVEKKADPRVAFGYGGASSMKSYGIPNIGIHKHEAEGGGTSASGLTLEKEYEEPWDEDSYYPVTLPLRPRSPTNPINPEGLNEEEIYNENAINPATELGIMEKELETSMFFLQLPAILPFAKQPADVEGSEMADNSKPLRGPKSSAKACKLDELPAGLMGKMLVYRSGAVKLKLGDTLYDVSTGLDCVFAQDVVAVNTEEKHCCALGQLNKRVMMTPDLDDIIDNISDLQ